MKEIPGNCTPDIDHGQSEKGEECNDEKQRLPEHRHLGELELQLKVLDVLLCHFANVLDGDDWPALGVQVGEVQGVCSSLHWVGSVQLGSLN